MLLDEIIFFIKVFKKYKNNTYEELYNFLIQSYNHSQFKVFKNRAKIYGFVNWAFVNKNVKKFLSTIWYN